MDWLEEKSWGPTPKYRIVGRGGVEKIGFPMRLFEKGFNLDGRNTPSYYRRWTDELLRFAKLLQHPKAVYYCSN